MFWRGCSAKHKMLGMVENDQKHLEMMKKVLFPSCVREAHVRRMKKNKETNFQRTFCVMHMSIHVEKKSKWATSFWGSLPIADQQTIFFIFLHVSYTSLSCTRWKKYFFHHFQIFYIVFDHANACASMRSLVEIHNTCYRFLPVGKVGNTDLSYENVQGSAYK